VEQVLPSLEPATRPLVSRRVRCLGAYVDTLGRQRELLARPGVEGTVLVIDADALGRDGRLLAHLAADEPLENAELVCRDYLLRAPADPRRFRRVTADDLSGVPCVEPRRPAEAIDTGGPGGERLSDRGGRAGERLIDPGGSCYELSPERRTRSIAQLRWWCRRGGEVSSPVSLRDVVAAIESYEPACAITWSVLQRWCEDRVSTTVLRAELQRLQESPIVLNRRLREAVLAAVELEGLSMSEIAIRCGRVKRDRDGNISGETSWLARRLGLLRDASHSIPTPWIHSDVLALIARRGLGLSPREVEA
jgi:hypothetical protein